MTTLTANFDNVKAHAPAVFYTFPEKNNHGESITMHVGAYHNAYRKLECLETQVYVTRPDGKCVEKYNPTQLAIKITDDYGNTTYRRNINPEWQLENTPENRMKLFNEIERLAFE